jgi:hypothetical protein
MTEPLNDKITEEPEFDPWEWLNCVSKEWPEGYYFRVIWKELTNEKK